MNNRSLEESWLNKILKVILKIFTGNVGKGVEDSVTIYLCGKRGGVNALLKYKEIYMVR